MSTKINFIKYLKPENPFLGSQVHRPIPFMCCHLHSVLIWGAQRSSPLRHWGKSYRPIRSLGELHRPAAAALIPLFEGLALVSSNVI